MSATKCVSCAQAERASTASARYANACGKKEITMSTKGRSDARHVVNQVYDILYVMGMTIFLSLWKVKVEYFLTEMLHVVIDNNEKIFLLGPRGLLDIDSNFGFKKSFFPKRIGHWDCCIQPSSPGYVVYKMTLRDRMPTAPMSRLLVSTFHPSEPKKKCSFANRLASGNKLWCFNGFSLCRSSTTLMDPFKLNDPVVGEHFNIFAASLKGIFNWIDTKESGTLSWTFTYSVRWLPELLLGHTTDSRLDPQKGLDLIVEAVPWMIVQSET
uniref:Uncharacterized protein n=1 Tax=Solanum lycopersicum TaxID=4081 RepID=A0A3Q7HAB4_SOLLC